MKISELAERAGFRALTFPDPDAEVTGGYVGDLLSWVMGRAKAGEIWITIMSNMNILAVASLSAVSAILLAEGVVPEEEVIKRATAQGINILTTDLSAFEAAVEVKKIMG